MRQIFTSPKTTGPARIAKAVGQFEKIINDIETGATEASYTMKANVETMQRLSDENNVLSQSINRGLNVANKLRELLA